MDKGHSSNRIDYSKYHNALFGTIPALTKGEKRPRLLLLLGITLYIALYNWIYITFLFPTWGYFGFDYNRPANGFLLLAFLLSVLPALWMPVDLTRPSQLLYWALYLVVFVPSMFVPLYMAKVAATQVALLMITLFLGMAVIGVGYLFPLGRLPKIRFSSGVFWLVFITLTMAFNLWIVLVFRSNLHVVASGDIYEVRFAADRVLEGSYLPYGIAFLSATLNPALMTLGLVYKRKVPFVAGVLGQILIFSAGAAKAVLFSVILVCGLYWLLRFTAKNFGLKFLGLIILLLFIIHSLNLMTGNVYVSIPWLIATLILFRTFGLPALNTGLFQHFFQVHPHTYMSQAHIVSWFIKYPYQNPVGLEVGYFYTGDVFLDANAHFWATDGIGGFGLPGILIISLLCALFLWLYDTAARNHSVLMGTVLLSYTALGLLNTSLLTSALSSGLFPSALLLYLMPSSPLKAGKTYYLRLASFKGLAERGAIKSPERQDPQLSI